MRPIEWNAPKVDPNTKHKVKMLADTSFVSWLSLSDICTKGELHTET